MRNFYFSYVFCFNKINFLFWKAQYYQNTFIYIYIYILFHRTRNHLFAKVFFSDLASGFLYPTV